MTTGLPTYRDGLLLAMVQGRIVAENDLHVSAMDRGLMFGDGVYEVIQSYAGKLWAAQAHFARLARSLKDIDIRNVDLRDVRTWVDDAFEAVGRVDCLIYFHITRGCALRAHATSAPLEPRFVLMITPAHDNTDKAQNGIAVITYPEIRWKRCDIKSLNLLANVMARREANRRGAGEAVFVDDGMITEAAVSSVFAVIDGTLVTRPLGPQILPGITRQAVLAIARMQGIAVDERCFSLDEIRTADEIILTGSGDEIRSAVTLDDKPVARGKPGPVARNIIDAFVEHTRTGGAFEDLPPVDS